MACFISCDGSRKAQQSMYGTWFSENGSASYYVDKCVALVEKYKMWLQNSEQLLSEKKMELLKARGEEIRHFLSLYTLDEIAAIQNGDGN